MTATVPSNEGIEDAYEQLESFVKRLPEGNDRTSAEHHLELSEAAAHRAREAATDGC
jgi:hypothetical protein